jgi:hypothetical protein
MLVIVLGAVVGSFAVSAWAAKFAESRIYIEYNESGNDLGFHVSLDGEDWQFFRIVNSAGATIFEVEGWGVYRDLGMTELFFEGVEPFFDEFPRADLFVLFPEGTYRFDGITVDGKRIASSGTLTHAVPAGPSSVEAVVDGGSVVISWVPVAGPPPGFPDRPIEIAAYQVLVDTFQVTLPATSTFVTLPLEFVVTFGAGEHLFEVLAIGRAATRRSRKPPSRRRATRLLPGRRRPDPRP